MELDIDYMDLRRETRRARWRMKLTALALLACVLMLGELVAQAKPVNDYPVSKPASAYEFFHPAAVPGHAGRNTIANSRSLIFNFQGGALSSYQDWIGQY